jgi:hypothetical protein
MNRSVVVWLLLSVCLTIRVHHTQTSAGGWTTGPSDPTIDQFIRGQFPGLSGATLISAQSQVVAGTNYLYTYQNGNTTWAVTAFNQPWNNISQITSVQKSTQWTDSNGNPVQTTAFTQLDSRDFTTIAASKISS